MHTQYQPSYDTQQQQQQQQQQRRPRYSSEREHDTPQRGRNGRGGYHQCTSQYEPQQNNNSEQVSSAQKRRMRSFFPEHLDPPSIMHGLKGGTLHQGILRILSTNSNNAFVTCQGLKRDVYIEGRKQRNRAFDGDVVVIELDEKIQIPGSPTPQQQPEQYNGHVVGILESKHVNQVAGYLQSCDSKDQMTTFIPLDSRYPHALMHSREWPSSFIPTKTYADNERQPLYIVQYQTWKACDMKPMVTLKQNLGLSGTIQAETEAILNQYEVDYDHQGLFSDDIMREIYRYGSVDASIAGQGWKIPESEILKRRDLRSWRIFSIDPTTARDLDDALSITKMDDGTCEIGVHIADVSYFIPPGSLLDKEAEHRATSIYLVERVIPMLPRILCEQLCSLNPGVDRLAYSCIWRMSADGSVISSHPVWYGHTVIRSCAKLDYQTAQLMIDHPPVTDPADGSEPHLTGPLATLCSPSGRMYPCDGHRVISCMNDCKLLNDIAKNRRAFRFDTGSLALHNVKLLFQLDEKTQNPLLFTTYTQLDSNRLVEEYMLLANMLVARQISRYLPESALLRCHPPPQERGLTRILGICHSLGFKVDVTSAGTLHRSLISYDNQYLPNAPNVQTRTLLEYILTKPMQQAKYFCTGDTTSEKEWHHYALNFSHYTHFTSPIRRYADVMVHRLLTYSLQLQASSTIPKTIPSYLEKEIVSNVAAHCNVRKVNAKKIGDQSSKVFLCELLARAAEHGDPPLIEAGIIVDMGDRSFDALIPHLGFEHRILLDDIYCRDIDIEPKKNPIESQMAPVDADGISMKSLKLEENDEKAQTDIKKRLRITWHSGETSVYHIFDQFRVQINTKSSPPIDIKLKVLPPEIHNNNNNITIK